MAHSSGIDYKEVLQDLRERRLKLDAAISAIEDIIGAAPAPTQGIARVPVIAPPLSSTGAKPGPYKGKTIIAAVMEMLRSEGKPLGTTVILRKLMEGGLKTHSKSFYRTLYNTLNSNLDKELTRKEKGGPWGLKEWEKKEEQADLNY